MADSKITALASIGTATDPALDPLVIVDVSDTGMASTGTTKKVTLNNLLSSSPTAANAFTVSGLLTAGSGSITGDLTVDTSTLKVDSAGDRVGILTTTINGGSFNVKVASAVDAKLVVQDGFTSGNVRLAAVDNAYSAYKTFEYSGASHLFYTNGGLKATLDSSGNLGLGTAPSAWGGGFTGLQVRYLSLASNNNSDSRIYSGAV